jgi:hypothetical protein
MILELFSGSLYGCLVVRDALISERLVRRVNCGIRRAKWKPRSLPKMNDYSCQDRKVWREISFATRRARQIDSQYNSINELGTGLLRRALVLHALVGENKMSNMKTLGLAIGLAFAASSFALAQQGTPAPAAGDQGNPAANAAASGGAGTHRDTPRTGTVQSTQKVQRNQHGYRHVYSYYRGGRCHLFHRPGSRHLVRICH